MLVDGKQIARDILEEVKATIEAQALPAPRLSAITCAPNFETRRYLEVKKQKAASVGVRLNVLELPATATTAEVIATVERVAAESDGVVVQLPLPSQIIREAVLVTVPVTKDPDGFHYGDVEGACLPPVVGAIDEIAKRHDVEWVGKRVVVLGEGRLVGRPAAVYARERGGVVTVLTEATYDASLLRTADILITGIGKPHFITPDLVNDGVVVFDAGTSEDSGVLAGDVHPDVGKKAALMTPVPGGIGPITIAYLLRNLVQLTQDIKH